MCILGTTATLTEEIIKLLENRRVVVKIQHINILEQLTNIRQECVELVFNTLSLWLVIVLCASL